MILKNIIIPFDGLHASIPASFARDTRFDSKVVKGASSSLGTTGGAATHTHSANHNHAIASHRHVASVGGRIDGQQEGMGNGGGPVEQNHGHNNGFTGYSNGEVSADTNVTFDAHSNLPAYYSVIFIKALAPSIIPEDGMIFRMTDRSGMDFHTASENKYLRGAAAAANAGATGGSNTHSHTQSHTHSVNAHTHADGVTGSPTGGTGEDGMSSPSLSHNHNHSISVQSSTQNMNANTDNTDTVSLEPLHKTLKHYVAPQPTILSKGDIALTTETVLPIGWLACDGNNGTPNLDGFYVKNHATAGTQAGSNTHAHTLSHIHTGSGTHSHTPNNPTGYGQDQGGRNGSGKDGIRGLHRHNVTFVETLTADYATTAAASTTVNSEPEYIKAKYIMYDFSINGGILYSFV